LREPFGRFVERELCTGVLLITCGLPGTWKTETSEEISRIKGYPILRSDLIRLEVLKGEDIFDEKVASNMSKRTRVYDETFRRADEALEKGDSVILDATFVTQPLRRRAAGIAARHKKTFVILQTHCATGRGHCPDTETLQRELRIECPHRAGLPEQQGEVRRSGPGRPEASCTPTWHPAPDR
jgi:hypothetical protein